MVDVGNVISEFYSEFVLRDLLSFVTPGAIVLGSVLYLIWPVGFLLHLFYFLNPLLFIPLFGMCYIIGIGLLVLGDADNQNNSSEYRWWIPPWPKNRFPTFHALTAEQQQTIVKRFYRNLTNQNTKDQFSKIRERYIIFMQTCGNCYTSFFFSGIIFLIKLIFNPFNEVIPTLVIFLGMLIGLFIFDKGYFIQKKRLKSWDESRLYLHCA
jgi:hypothetical protein